MKKQVSILILEIFVVLFMYAQKGYTKVFLWRDVDNMRLNVRDTVLYYPKDISDNSKVELKSAVVICPGGSYHHLGMPHEGFASARWFKEQGIVPFVLRYRVAYNGHHYPAQLQDIQRAIYYIRENAGQFGIDPDKIGAIGYSAGGHLVAMAGAFGDTVNEISSLGFDKYSVRPDFVMPVYPVVSMQDDIGHRWSRNSLLGSKQSQQRKDRFSLEFQIPDDMVPVFLLACKDDPVVKFENSVRLQKSLAEKNISHEFAVYEKGGHGFGMKEGWFLEQTKWNDTRLKPWLIQNGVIKK